MTDPLLDVGAVLGETYRIQALIGRGGMGAVWAAEHLRLPGKHVAVKVLLDAAAGGDEMLQRFRREAEIASRLGHPNIVEVLDFNTPPDGTALHRPRVPRGRDARRRGSPRDGCRSTRRWRITRQIGSALQAAHRAGVVHRDLKPDNIFLCTTERRHLPTRVKVLDFGISKIRGSPDGPHPGRHPHGDARSTCRPEQATGKNTAVDARTDVFALGAIVYEMLGGQPAFAGGSLAEVVYRVVHGQPTPLRELAPALPDNVLDAVDRALQKDPAARPQDIGAFILELTGRPLHSFHTGQPRNVDSAVGAMEPHPHPRIRRAPPPRGPRRPPPRGSRSARERSPSLLRCPRPRRGGSCPSWPGWRCSGWRWEARESSGPRGGTPRRRRRRRASARSSR